jgi:hypothetical protein
MFYFNLIAVLLLGIASATSVDDAEQSSKGCPLRQQQHHDHHHRRHSSSSSSSSYACSSSSSSSRFNPNASCAALNTVYELTKKFQAAVGECDWQAVLALSAPCLLVDTIGTCPGQCCYINQSIGEWIASYGDCALKHTQYQTQPARWSTTLYPDGLVVVQGYQIDTYLGIPPSDQIWNVKFFWKRCCDPAGTYKLVSITLTSEDCLDDILALEDIGQQPQLCAPDCVD